MIDIPQEVTDRFGYPIYSKSSEIEVCFRCQECDKKSLFLNLTNQLFICLHCGFKGKFTEFKKGEIDLPQIDYPLQLEILNDLASQLKLYDDCVEELKTTRAIYQPELFKLVNINSNVYVKLLKQYTNEQLVNSGLVRETDQGYKVISHFFYKNILIPFFYLGEVVGYKVRRRILIEDETRYLAFPGFNISNYFYSPFLYNHDYIIVTEGEFKTMSTLTQGFNCVGLHGIRCNPICFNNLCNLIEEKQYKTIYTIFDNSSINNIGVDKLIGQFHNYFGTNHKNITLPLLNKTKMDLDSFFSLNGNLLELLQC